VALGSMGGILLALYLASKDNLSVNRCLDLSIYVLISSILGARVLYVAAFWQNFKSNPLEAFMVWQGGLVFYGGLISAIIVLVVAAGIYKMPIWKILDVATPGTALALAVGRIGCFLRGCCYGVQTDSPLGMHFPHLEGAHHPTQLYEMAYAFLLMFFLLWLWKRRKYEGQVFIAGLMIYSILRFYNESLRDVPHYLLGLTGSQWISILLLAVAAVLYAVRKRQNI
jgi:phosphatidylglycerol---prolipoprotein diacylglyceryl transferase